MGAVPAWGGPFFVVHYPGVALDETTFHQQPGRLETRRGRKMKYGSLSIGLLTLGALLCFPALAQQPVAPPSASPSPTAKAAAEEVLLDIIVRDKKGKPVTDLKPEELTITDGGVAQPLTSFRLVRGS